MKDQLLVALTGPVGGGKSAVALALADHLRAHGSSAAVIDLDVVYSMVRQRPGFGDPNAWRTARRAAASLAEVCFTAGMDTVLVEGEFFNARDWDEVRSRLPGETRSGLVTLAVAYENVLRRVQGDPSRGMSRNPQFLQRLHTEFLNALPFLKASGWVLDADNRTPQDLAAVIARRLLSRAGATTHHLRQD
jgi:hypothetical protein